MALSESNAGASSAEGSEGAAGGSKGKVVVIIKAPWDPMNSQDWDKESHTKEALMRIKRWVQTVIGYTKYLFPLQPESRVSSISTSQLVALHPVGGACSALPCINYPSLASQTFRRLGEGVL